MRNYFDWCKQLNAAYINERDQLKACRAELASERAQFTAYRNEIEKTLAHERDQLKACCAELASERAKIEIYHAELYEALTTRGALKTLMGKFKKIPSKFRMLLKGEK